MSNKESSTISRSVSFKHFPKEKEGGREVQAMNLEEIERKHTLSQI